MDYREIMSGRRRDPSAILFRAAAHLAAIPYGLAIRIRNRRFDRAAAEIHSAPVPVISIGNITAGGTGKTPLVVWLARWFRQHGVRVSIVSRGYRAGATGQGMNDEALELQQQLPDVPHVQDPDRVAAARIAVEELDSQLILLDDGFQHRRLHRDLDLVLIDCTCPFGYGRLLPRGLLREPLSGLHRADVIVLTRCDLVDAATKDKIIERIRRVHPAAQICESMHRPSRLVDHHFAAREPLTDLRGAQITAVCGIGNPDAFFATLKELGAELRGQLAFPDHAAYDRDAVDRIRETIRSASGSTMCLCTTKDLVKLQTDQLAGVPLRGLEIALEIGEGREWLENHLNAVRNKLESRRNRGAPAAGPSSGA